MKQKVYVEIRIVDISESGLHYNTAILEDTMLKEQFAEYFHDFCRNFFCKSTMLKMPPAPSMEYSYSCEYRYEWLPSHKFGTTLIAKSELCKEYLIFHVKDIRHEEHIL